MSTKENLQHQFIGYQKTPLLWQGSLFGLSQFDLTPSKEIEFSGSIEKRLRLGHLVEHFVGYELDQQKDVSILGKNVQVYSNKQTIGEFDFLVRQNGEDCQIEVVYKFYLYDKTQGISEFDHWIGPNRKDSLVQKIEKIKEKQFPLIEREEATELLETLKINVADIQQRVYFKAKLFVPYGAEIEMDQLNRSCVTGFYLSFDDLKIFKESQLYIPSKHDWLKDPDENVQWMSYHEAQLNISRLIKEKRSPLVWFKTNGRLLTGFVVWWRND